MSERLGIVGSPEKDPNGNDISLEKYRETGFVEVFCKAADFVDFSSGIGVPISLKKGALAWKGEMAGFRLGVVNDAFTPRDFIAFLEGMRVGIYTIRMDPETPVSSDIIGAKAYLG